MYEVLSFKMCRKGGIQQEAPVVLGSGVAASHLAARLVAGGRTAVILYRGPDEVQVIAAAGDLAEAAVSYACGS